MFRSARFLRLFVAIATLTFTLGTAVRGQVPDLQPGAAPSPTPTFPRTYPGMPPGFPGSRVYPQMTPGMPQGYGMPGMQPGVGTTGGMPQGMGATAMPQNFGGARMAPGFGAPAAPSSAVAPAALAMLPEILQHAQGSLALVEGHEGAGSGFICELGGQKFLVTNAHVLAGNSQVNFTMLDGSPVRVGGAAVAVGHDMVRLAVAPELPAFGVLDRVNETLLVGDDVLVLGNEKGAHVVTTIMGKVVGLGPNLVEVDAPFQPGNSGSPIIQMKTGKVVGIATYLREERDEEAERTAQRQRFMNPQYMNSPSALASQSPAITKVRRFGYRLDSVKGWQGIAWPEFQAEAAVLKKSDALTDDIVSLTKDIHDHHGYISENIVHSPAVERPLHDFFDAMDHHPSPTDALKARQDLLDSMRRVCQSDLADLRPRLRYDYFQRKAEDLQRGREELAKSFAEAIKAQTNTTGR